MPITDNGFVFRWKRKIRPRRNEKIIDIKSAQAVPHVVMLAVRLPPSTKDEAMKKASEIATELEGKLALPVGVFSDPKEERIGEIFCPF